MLFNILQCTGQPPKQTTILLKMAGVARLRNPNSAHGSSLRSFLFRSSSSFITALLPWTLAEVNYSHISGSFHSFQSTWHLWAPVLAGPPALNMFPFPSSAGELSLLILLCLPLNLHPLGSLPHTLGPHSVYPQQPCLPLPLDLSHCNETDLILLWHLFGSDSTTHQWV